MAKVLTRLDRLKKEYSSLYDLNQKLKLISSIYYICGDGVVLMKSLVPFLESFVELRYPDKYELFINGIITPNKFFDFGKRVKKSKMLIREIEDEDGKRFYFTQEDYPEKDLSYTLNIVKEDVNVIKEKFNYKRIFEIQNTDKYEVYDSTYYPLDSGQVEDLCNAKYMEITLPNGEMIPLTKELFMDIKNGDYIQIAKVAKQRIPGDREIYRVFYLISHDTDLYTSYTIFNKVSS